MSALLMFLGIAYIMTAAVDTLLLHIRQVSTDVL